MLRSILAIGAVSAAAAATLAAPVSVSADLEPLQSGLDYHSFANVEQFRVQRLELDLRVDMAAKTLAGVVGLQIKRLDPGATELILDTRDLNIADVSVKAQDVFGATSKDETTWVSRPFHVERKDPIRGQALVIELPPSKRASEFVRIEYETQPGTPALHWLTAKQTGQKAFFYTSSEPIGARSWIPLQDTPEVRFTYKALIHTHSSALALMSAVNDPAAKHNGDYSFVMTEAIPSYLMALAVGDLKYQALGVRAGVYAPRALLKQAAREFADTDALLDAGEKTLGPYRFGRLDIVVMPAAFDSDGMGYPRLNFVSPTLIAGDKSQVSSLARQVARSWAGDSVSTATWHDAWINEGLAAYLGNRLTAAVYGERRVAMERVLAWQTLQRDLGSRKPVDQILALDLRERDPAAVFDGVVSGKGELFMTNLDVQIGRERFDEWLRGYFEHFAFKSVTTEQFTQYLKNPPHTVLQDWIAAPGIPADAQLPATDAFTQVDEARSLWISGSVPAKRLVSNDWNAAQWRYFLSRMPALSAAQLQDLHQAFGFAHGPNAVLEAEWLLLVVRNQYQPGYARLEEYLESIGRGGLILPLYAELMKTPAGQVQALRVYQRARPLYAPRITAMLDSLVAPSTDVANE